MSYTYRILDKDTDTLLMSDDGFVSEEDARLQAEMEAKVENIKNYYILVKETK